MKDDFGQTNERGSEGQDGADGPEGKDLVFNTTPNMLTLGRIALVPVLVIAMFFETSEWDLVAALIFGLASITDYFDGYIARIQKSETVYGKLMDPLADKFLIISGLIMLMYSGRIHPVVVILLVCRELTITGLRALASAEGIIIAASPSAKWKTGTQMVAVIMLILNRDVFGWPVIRAGHTLLYISLGISLWSARDYVVGFFAALRARRKTRRKTKELSDPK